MKAVTILSAGPSLELFKWRSENTECYIGVNRAVEKHGCRYWVFRDPCSAEWDPKNDKSREGDPKPILFIPKDPRLDDVHADLEREFWEDTLLRDESPMWIRFSMGPALWLAREVAHKVGAKLIRVYGADMKGENDFAGGSPRLESDRDETRWGLEWEMWDTIAQHFRWHDKVDVCRIL